MKCSESWLREWVNPSLTREELSHSLTMGGLEVEDVAPAAASFKNIFIGEIREATKHPDAEKLQICKVTLGDAAKLLTIVCGAANARPGLKVAVAIIGAELPNGKTITPATIRGAASEGMLCSASELQFSDQSEGILELAATAPIGANLWDYLQLTDYTFDISITPNRSDCLSVRGVARDISALTSTPLISINIPETLATIQTQIPITIKANQACPRYIGRIIKNVTADAITPIWLTERLRRSGIRSISPVVDVTNYVMLELGQPMHAFDFEKINEEIQVRWSQAGEKINLLDGSEKELNNETLVIADKQKPLAIAGVMGGMDSSVTLLTKDILLESAFFSPQVIARQRQFYNLNSDSAYRFERGVDSTIQRQAIERATQLIIEICGGEVGPVMEKESLTDLPKSPIISISATKISNILGIIIPDAEIENIFQRLNFKFTQQQQEWRVEVPPYRFDITIPEDLVEEVARLYGYNKIPTHKLKGFLNVNKAEESINVYPLRIALRDLGYHEIISYSFISEKIQHLLDPDHKPRELVNPITADMSVMRTNLWGGLINTLMYNLSRQQQRIRLFEIGTCFIANDQELNQPIKLAGLVSGEIAPEQWGQPKRNVDFFDVKGDLETLLTLQGFKNLEFKPAQHPALHPGQTANIYAENKFLGIVGALHPSILQSLDLNTSVFLFEFDLNDVFCATKIQYQEISKFPEIRRDLAFLINQTIPAQEIQDTIRSVAGDWLKELFIFDVYQGKGIPAGLKSVALGLILQHPTRTLVDEEVTVLINRVIEALKGQLGAELRS